MTEPMRPAGNYGNQYAGYVVFLVIKVFATPTCKHVRQILWHLIWVYIVCSSLSVPILRVNTLLHLHFFVHRKFHTLRHKILGDELSPHSPSSSLTFESFPSSVAVPG